MSAETPNDRLRDAVEDVYRVFTDITKPTEIDGCPCCIDEKGLDVLLSKPLRSITPDELTSYACSVFLTVGCVDDFLYFLPRILEILATDPDWWPNPEIVARAIRTAEFCNWPVHRREAVHRYIDAVFEVLIAVDDSGEEIDSWVCALGRLFPDIAPYLTRICEHPRKLIEYYEVNRKALAEGYLRNDFWAEAPETAKQVVDWFNSPESQKLIAASYPP